MNKGRWVSSTVSRIGSVGEKSITFCMFFFMIDISKITRRVMIYDK